MNVVLVVCVIFVGMLAHPSKCAMTEDELKDFLANVYEKMASDMCTRLNEAEWNYDTDINNEEKQQILLNVTLEAAALQKDNWQKYFKDLNPDDYQDEEIKRQVKDLRILGNAALDEEKLSELTTTTNSMTNIYSTAKICPYTNINCDLSKDGLSLEPGIEAVLAKSSDYDELAYVWKTWRDASGAKMRDLYKIYVDLSNEAAVANDFKDKGELWRDSYESPTFIQDMDDLWSQVEPLYAELHKYVGNKLKEVYGDKLDNSDGLLPAHIFGNMWAQEWNNIAQLVKPFPNASKVDVDQALIDQKYTVLDMFKTSDNFYQSMGLVPNDICYNTSAGAMIEKPTDGREVLCHASAWDFCDGQNYRIKMCTEVNYEDFVVIHHEMGHIQYYLQYAEQPYNFRDGANPGFHEAIGDTIALSVSTPKHLQKINLLQDYEDTDESSINALMDIALQKVAFLPFGLLIDKWRWDVFSGAVTQDNWNSHWWEYRKQYQKLRPPVPRADPRDFDPGAKFHVAGDSQYIAYFVAHIVQFQFYRSLCIAAGEYNPDDKEVPLHKCDFYESTAAGEKLRDGLSLGASKHWSDVLEVMTEERKLDATALLEYFEPLYNFLKEQNQKLKL
jgi:peptidyl-dipeptidase A